MVVFDRHGIFEIVDPALSGQVVGGCIESSLIQSDIFNRICVNVACPGNAICVQAPPCDVYNASC